jgi:hypothetical protein
MSTASAPCRAPLPARSVTRPTRSAGRRPAATATAGVLLLASCAATGSPGAASAPLVAASGHGSVAGAEELSEPALSLALADRRGTLTLVDLTVGTSAGLPGGGGPVDAMTGDGRFVHPSRTVGDRTTVEIIDSGRWTVEHGDHFHHYRSTGRAVGAVTGTGPSTIRSADRRTAIAFPDSGEVIVLAQDDLATGSLGDPATVTRDPHPGLLVLPFAGHLLTTTPDRAGAAGTVEILDRQGQPTGAGTPCPQASDATTTRVGAVVACADGAVLVTATDDAPAATKIPYPPGVAPAARSLDGRSGRPVVAGATDPATDPAGGSRPSRVRHLDTRARQWAFRPTDIPLVAVSAVGDNAGLTVAVDDAGRIRVFDADGTDVGTSAPLLASSTAGPATRERIGLMVDANRAYVSGPAEGVILEVDYRDGARIARTFDGADPQFFEQVG